MRTAGPANYQELSSSRDGWFVGSNDVLVGHRRCSVRDILHSTVSQYSSPDTAATVLDLVLDDVGSMHVLRSSLDVEEMFNCNSNAMRAFCRYTGWRDLWNPGNSFQSY